ncbi:unnamed protein product [Adineta ricciae]|uniref:Phosphatidate phosphatase APP1 catalytic domain-containing protein n=1 Tax=Adineta ricciae TaxID=249248 RepID=A0A815DQ48_ADIRI|nr:unnamed protein product [Adineta ricciae]CAF1301037.1 unnamed protein product [Adineta ricciae]
MVSYSLLFIVLCCCAIHIDGRKRFHDIRERRFWQAVVDKLKNKTVNKFHIDFRRFEQEDMVLYPDVAFESLKNDSTWNVVIHGWRYESNHGRSWLGITLTRWVERIAKHLLDPDAIVYLNGSLNRDRLKPFFVDDESNDVIEIKVGTTTQSLRTDVNGQFYGELLLTNNQIQSIRQQQQLKDNIITYEATGDNQDKAQGVIRLIEPRQGISVISDVDDTIKISEVLDKVRLIANTFIYPFKPVPGMADLYRQWYTANANCTFHYLSGMPDQLYTLTQEFIYTNNFPDGSFHMRHFGWAAASLFDFLHSDATFTHKIKHLRFFLSNTIRDYVLVGDSGEKDPEIYGTIAREYPQRIRAIFIRAIKNEDFNDRRFLTAFEGIPSEKWQVFDNPQQLPTDLSRSPRATAH